ncbi:MAG: hypothetical protein ACO3N7_02825 [Kiritimatiellia bacterium]
MSDPDFELDEEPTPSAAKASDGVPAWMLALVIVPTVCFLLVLALQFMEYRYLRGGSESGSDPYAAQAVLPS